MFCRTALPLVLFIYRSRIIQGCSPLPPCGTKVRNLSLTDVPGVLHLHADKYADCADDVFSSDWQSQSSALFELQMSTGSLKAETDSPFTAQQTDLGLSSFPTVDQNYRLSYTAGSEDVLVERDGLEFTTFTLPGFQFKDGDANSQYDGLVQFFSESMDTFYFIYHSSGNDENEKLAVCKTGGSCTISDFTPGTFSLARNSDQMTVYDDISIVGLEVPCCLCVGKYYFAFDENGLTFTSVVNDNSLVDPRIGVVYNVVYGDSIEITAESIPNREQSIAYSARVRLDDDILEEAFSSP